MISISIYQWIIGECEACAGAWICVYVITRRNAAKEYEKNFEDLDSFSVMKVMREEQVQFLCMSEQRKHKEASAANPLGYPYDRLA